jgi:hypothetical protein
MSEAPTSAAGSNPPFIPPSLHRRPGRIRAAQIPLIVLALVALSCAATQQASLPPPAPAAGPYYEEELLPPPPPLHLEIVSLNELQSPDASTVTLNGVLRNGGGRATKHLRVTIQALDADGNTVATVEALPSSEHVEPNATVMFSAVTASHPDVRRYHVEAIGR